MKRVILDMDPGVDDALAIILAMLSPQLRVEAITTVSGNVHVDLCTQNVLRILEILKPETPPVVARGEAVPLTATIPMTSTSPIDNITGADVHGQDGLGNLDKLSITPKEWKLTLAVAGGFILFGILTWLQRLLIG